MLRRDLLKLSLALPLAGAAFPALATDGWRRYRLTVVAEPSAQWPLKLWLPLPAETPWQKVESTTWQVEAPTVAVQRDGTYGAQALYADWPDTSAGRRAELVFVVATRDRQGPAGEAGDLARYLAPTPTMPTGGLVKARADEITAGRSGDMAKARAIYDWIVENCFRDPKVKGCGNGDIRFMLESGNLGGKCADINALFVGLARASGIPAREVFGIRAADSRQFKSLGKAGDISRAQHCRAEFYAAGQGWIPVDPADVRKAVLEENLPLTDPKIAALREALFGSWEMNWVAFNSARDFVLPPGPADAPINYFMYPEGMTPRGALDGMDPDGFRYRITSEAA